MFHFRIINKSGRCLGSPVLACNWSVIRSLEWLILWIVRVVAYYGSDGNTHSYESCLTSRLYLFVVNITTSWCHFALHGGFLQSDIGKTFLRLVKWYQFMKRIGHSFTIFKQNDFSWSIQLILNALCLAFVSAYLLLIISLLFIKWFMAILILLVAFLLLVSLTLLSLTHGGAWVQWVEN